MTNEYSTSNLRDITRNHPRATKWVVYSLVFGLGFALAATIYAKPYPVEKTVTKQVEVPVEKRVTQTVYKTPDACRQALEIDNALFVRIADSLSSLEFAGLATDIEAKTPGRTALYLECVEA